MDNIEQLKIELTNKLIDSANYAKNVLKYNPAMFFQMLSKYGGFETARRLINADKISDGFATLWEFKKLELTVEAIAITGPWKVLFSEDELKKANDRLKACGYSIDTDEFEASDNRAWTKEELEASVDAYLLMLNRELSHEQYNKAEINRELRDGILNKRTKSSIEFRMQNISAVMEALCLPRIKGYLPAKNIGSNIYADIKQILIDKKHIDADIYEPTDNEIEFNNRVSKILKDIEPGKPIGVKSPEKTNQNVMVYKRDPLVKAWILRNANGICEKCNKNGPFLKDDGTIYLEVHHITALSEGGCDTINNTVALCPNCHREIHYSSNRRFIIEDLIEHIERITI